MLDVPEDRRMSQMRVEHTAYKAAAEYLKVYQRRFQGVTMYAFKFGRGGPGRDFSPHRTNMENAAHHRPAMRRLALLLRLSVFFFCWSGAHLGAGFAKTYARLMIVIKRPGRSVRRAVRECAKVAS